MTEGHERRKLAAAARREFDRKQREIRKAKYVKEREKLTAERANEAQPGAAQRTTGAEQTGGEGVAVSAPPVAPLIGPLPHVILPENANLPGEEAVVLNYCLNKRVIEVRVTRTGVKTVARLQKNSPKFGRGAKIRVQRAKDLKFDVVGRYTRWGVLVEEKGALPPAPFSLSENMPAKAEPESIFVDTGAVDASDPLRYAAMPAPLVDLDGLLAEIGAKPPPEAEMPVNLTEVPYLGSQDEDPDAGKRMGE